MIANHVSSELPSKQLTTTSAMNAVFIDGNMSVEVNP